MKQFNIHRSIKWGIRVLYTLIILAFMGYVGLGIFLKSNLARETLVRKLSDVAGRPVHIGMVALDWFHGFHIVLKDVKIPSGEKGIPPWLVCRNITTTISVFPLVMQKKLIFKQLKIEDGSFRITRDLEGVWKGVFPIPVETPPEEPRIASPRKKKGKVTILFPKVIIRRVSADFSYEKREGVKHIKIFLDKGQTTFHKERFTGEMEGYFQLSQHSRPTYFYARLNYALTTGIPFKASATLSNLPIGDLAALWGGKTSGKVSGVSQVSLSVGGNIRKSIAFHGKAVVHHLLYKVPRLEVCAPEKEMSLIFNGGSEIREKEAVNPHVTIEASPFQILLRGNEGGKRGQATFQKRLSFKGLTLKGFYKSTQKQIRFSLTSLYGLGEKDAKEPGKLHLSGNLSTQEDKVFGVAFTFTNVPLNDLFSTRKEKQEAISTLREDRGVSLRWLPLGNLEKVEGEIKGNMEGKTTSISSAHLSARWNTSRLSVHVSPFIVGGKRTVHLEIAARQIPAILAKHTPFIMDRLPLGVKGWCEALQGGRISFGRGKLEIERTSTGSLKGIQLREGTVSLSDLSIVLPLTGIMVEGFQGKLVYRAPGIKAFNLRFIADRVCRVDITKAEISNLFKKPIQIKCAGMIESNGMGFNLKEGNTPLSGLINLQLPKKVPFIPEYFEGKVGFSFDGALAPFSYKDYKITLQSVKLKGKMKPPWILPEGSFTLLASLKAQPGNIDVKRISIVSPFGGLVSEGRVKTDQEGKVTLSMRGKGQILIKEGDLQTLVPQADGVQLSGVAPFFLKAQGVWPELFVEGHMGGTGLSYGFRDVFRKKKGVKSAVDFQINQSGPHSFKIDWIRAAAGKLVVKLWGEIVSLFPLRGRVMCQAENQRIRSLLPLFPWFCNSPRCLLAKGEIQCLGDVDIQQRPVYNIKAGFRDVSIPLFKTGEPIQIDKASIVFGNRERSIDVRNFRYKKSVGRRLNLLGSLKEGQWFWTPEIEFGYLNLDDFIENFKHAGKPGGQKHEGVDPFALAISFMHGRYMKGFVSVDQLKVIGYKISNFFARFNQMGRSGEIKGLNFRVPNGFGAIDIFWKEVGKGKITLKLLPLVENLDFGKILTGLLHRDSPFTGILSFKGRLEGKGGTYDEIKKNLNGHLTAKFEDGAIKKWSVLSNIFRLLDVYDILLLKFPDIKGGLAYKKIEGSIDVRNGVAKTEDAHLESRPFYMAGEGSLKLKDGMLSLLVGVYPFKMVDTFISKIPLVGRIFTNKDKRFIGYFFEIKGHVKNPKVRSVNAKKLGKRVLSTFKKIITLPIYLFQNHPNREKKK